MSSFELECPDPPTSNTGAFQIRWHTPAAMDVELYEDGELIYAGGDPGTTVTGRSEGAHVYSLRADGQPERSCTVSVEPPPLGLALGLFGIGALVFAMTLALILRGERTRGARG